MKRIILVMLILVLTLSLFGGVMVVNAETDMSNVDKNNIRQISGNVTFYNATNMTQGDIVLPDKYWVIGVGKINSFYEVKYNGVRLLVNYNTWEAGMTKYNANHQINDISEIQFAPSTELKAELPEFVDEVKLFSTKEYASSDDVVAIIRQHQTLIFLNAFTNSQNKDVYLVATEDNKIGYIPAQLTNRPNGDLIRVPDWEAPAVIAPVEPDAPVVPDNPGELTPNAGNNGDGTAIKPNEDTTPLPTKNNVVKIVLIVCICILAGVLVFLLFKPTRNKKTGRYAIDNDEDLERDREYDDNY